MFFTKCGKQIHDSAFMCEYCGQPLKGNVPPVPPAQPVTAAPAAVPEKRENVVAGIVGALLGALIGAAAIILLSMAGYIAAISGLILAICTFKGYELLGGKLSTKGILISIILILVTPYVADLLSWGIVIYQEFAEYYDVTFADCVSLVSPLIDEGAIDSGDYIGNLVMLYIFTILGGLSTVWSQLRGKKKK